MSSPDVFTTVETVLRSAWTDTPIYFENENWQTPAQPSHFVVVEVFGEFFDQVSIGTEDPADNRWREGGMIYGHVMTERGIGTLTARQHARNLVEIFRGQEIDGVSFIGASIGASEPGTEDGKFFRMTATIEWKRDTDV